MDIVVTKAVKKNPSESGAVPVTVPSAASVSAVVTEPVFPDPVPVTAEPVVTEQEEKSEKKNKSEKLKKSEKKDKLYRIEIIFSQAVEEDIFEKFREHNVGSHFSKISIVTGAGFSNPKLGDAIWPQVNEIIIVFCKKDEAEEIKNIIHELREVYPAEGIACFISKAKEL